jgi:NitT/TauT family transport system substrate-binding protein
MKHFWIALSFAASVVACSKKEPPPEPAPAAAASAAAMPSAAAPTPPTPAPSGPPLRVAYSDWPGWVAWDIALQKGWFKEAGVNVEFVWFEYVPSMEAYSAGKVDAVAVTNGDALVTGSSGAPSRMIMLNDFSNGNDMIVAKPGIKTMAELKGKTIGVEVGFVDHLLLLKALEMGGMKDKDVKILNVTTDQTPQTLKSGKADAVAAWQPNSGQALKELPGSTPVFTSKNVPGLIYDVLAVNPRSLSERRADWVKVVRVWFKIAAFVKDPANLDEAAKIMGARVHLTPDEYKKLMGGTEFLGAEENAKRFANADGLETLYGSSRTVHAFNTAHGVYKAPIKPDEYIDASLIQEAAKAP